jgi:hypothetical protein
MQQAISMIVRSMQKGAVSSKCQRRKEPRTAQGGAFRSVTTRGTFLRNPLALIIIEGIDERR